MHCSFWADNFNGIIVHLNQRDVTMIAVSRAPYSKLECTGSGWAGISISITTCHSHRKSWLRKKPSTTSLHKTLTIQSGKESAYFTKTLQVTCFTPIQSYARGIDMLNVAYHYLDIVPKGRDEAGHEFPQFWVRRDDEYDKQLRS